MGSHPATDRPTAADESMSGDEDQAEAGDGEGPGEAEPARSSLNDLR